MTDDELLAMHQRGRQLQGPPPLRPLTEVEVALICRVGRSLRDLWFELERRRLAEAR